MVQFDSGTSDVQGCFRVLDQSKSQVGRRQPLPKCSAADKASSSKVVGQSSATTSRGKQKKVAVDNGGKKSTARNSATHTKLSVKQRLHPGLISIQDRTTDHYGAVTGLKATEDGVYLLSAGSDSRIRLWDVESDCNTLVNYETVRLQNHKPIQLAVAQDSSLVFVPCMSTVKAFDIWSGTTSLTFRGHYESVNCCWYSPEIQELYTGGHDRQILVWSPPSLSSDEMEIENDKTKRWNVPAPDEDNWSD